ncbi:hypothetical protein F66182_10562 [Fusarium sp. NRRL 66182]|nr:hypothetical protein F66182_10562 [Fusarium sp. NRRL 66182]
MDQNTESVPCRPLAAGIYSKDTLNVVLENPALPATKRQRPAYLVPQTEEQWQKSRLVNGLATLEDVIDKAASLEDLNWRELHNWEKIVAIAATIVDLDVGIEEDAINFGTVYAGVLSYDTHRRDRATVLNLIRLLDRLYPGLGHRAFELLIIWNMPLSRIRLWTSKNFDDMFSKNSGLGIAPKQEPQISNILYIPFLVQIIRPQYSLKTIQRALKTKTLTQRDLVLCRETRRSYAPGFGTSPAIAEKDSDPGNTTHTAYPVAAHVRVLGYTAFEVSQELQRRASKAYKKQDICNLIESTRRDVIHSTTQLGAQLLDI